jgi:hypothetical protein
MGVLLISNSFRLSESGPLSMPEFSILRTNNKDFFQQHITMNKNKKSTETDKSRSRRSKLFVLKCSIPEVIVCSDNWAENK